MTVAVLAFLGACAAAPTRLERVTCSGATELTEGHLYAWLKANLPTELNRVSPAALRADLLAALPYNEVRVERRWPQQLLIEVEERKPYAMILADDGAVGLLDRQGRMATLRRDQELALWDRPAIRGCDMPGPAATESSDCVNAAIGFVSLIDYVRPTWLASLSEVRVIGDRVQVYLNDGTPIRFGAGPIEPQLETLEIAWNLAQKNTLAVRGIRIVDAERIVLQTRTHSENTGA